LGALAGVSYKAQDWAEQLKQLSGGFDVIIDSALGDGFAKLLDVIKPGGRIVFFGGTAGGNIPELNGRKIFWRHISILGTTLGSPFEFGDMVDYFDQNKLKPVVDEVFPLADAEKAMQMMAHSSHFGKLVLSI
jgi:zinc-binding alcohol dehydrogenase/oxidoreductase